MESWRNWSAQESYTFKVVGSSPTLSTKIGEMAEWSIAKDCKSFGLTTYVCSNRTFPTFKYGVYSSVGRALVCGTSGHRFKSYCIP